MNHQIVFNQSALVVVCVSQKSLWAMCDCQIFPSMLRSSTISAYNTWLMMLLRPDIKGAPSFQTSTKIKLDIVERLFLCILPKLPRAAFTLYTKWKLRRLSKILIEGWFWSHQSLMNLFFNMALGSCLFIQQGSIFSFLFRVVLYFQKSTLWGYRLRFHRVQCLFVWYTISNNLFFVPVH